MLPSISDVLLPSLGGSWFTCSCLETERRMGSFTFYADNNACWRLALLDYACSLK